MPIMVQVWDWQLDRLKDQGIVVTCAQCQFARERDGSELKARGTGLAVCPIVRAQVLLDQPLICSDFKERSS